MNAVCVCAIKDSLLLQVDPQNKENLKRAAYLVGSVQGPNLKPKLYQ